MLLACYTLSTSPRIREKGERRQISVFLGASPSEHGKIPATRNHITNGVLDASTSTSSHAVLLSCCVCSLLPLPLHSFISTISLHLKLAELDHTLLHPTSSYSAHHFRYFNPLSVWYAHSPNLCAKSRSSDDTATFANTAAILFSS